MVPDGERIAALLPVEDTEAKPGQENKMVLLLNFFDELRRKAQYLALKTAAAIIPSLFLRDSSRGFAAFFICGHITKHCMSVANERFFHKSPRQSRHQQNGNQGQ